VQPLRPSLGRQYEDRLSPASENEGPQVHGKSYESSYAVTSILTLTLLLFLVDRTNVKGRLDPADDKEPFSSMAAHTIEQLRRMRRSFKILRDQYSTRSARSWNHVSPRQISFGSQDVPFTSYTQAHTSIRPLMVLALSDIVEYGVELSGRKLEDRTRHE
jgi:hypothetical protein